MKLLSPTNRLIISKNKKNSQLNIVSFSNDMYFAYIFIKFHKILGKI